jgi:hypothetical protein
MCGVATRRSWRRRARAALRDLRALRLPPIAWAIAAAAALGAATFAYQLARKPTEIIGLVVPSAPKQPAATWAEYGGAFEAHSTPLVPPELLAALAQAESAGDPLALSRWSWRWSWNPLDLYGPSSSAVGLLQMTDANYEAARRLCIHDHAVVEEGPWIDPRACWFNALYLRTVPGHAVEMTAAWLHRSVEEILRERRSARATAAQKQRLAAVVHLCGRARAAAFARRGFWVLPGESCGEHDLARYLERVEDLRETFARISGRESRQ